jgi:hypothetical protein
MREIPLLMTGEAKGRGASKTPKPVSDATQAPTTVAIPTPRESWTSIDIFGCCIERAKNLLKLHAAAHGRQSKPAKYMSDAHRAAIVLSVSALDAFVRSFVIERVRFTLADQERGLPGALRDKIKAFLKDDDLLEASRRNDLLERVDKAFRADFEKRSFQGATVISEHMKIVGIDDIFHEVAKHAKCNEDELRHDLDRFTSRRHAIAHRGDYDLSKNPPSENPVTKQEARACIRLVELVASHVSKLGVK